MYVITIQMIAARGKVLIAVVNGWRKFLNPVTSYIFVSAPTAVIMWSLVVT